MQRIGCWEQDAYKLIERTRWIEKDAYMLCFLQDEYNKMFRTGCIEKLHILRCSKLDTKKDMHRLIW